MIKLYSFIGWSTILVSTTLILRPWYRYQGTSAKDWKTELDPDDKLVELFFQGPLAANDSRLLSYMRRRVLVPPSLNNYNLSNDYRYRMESRRLSYGFIRKHIEKLFEKGPPGFFVEAGGLDGEFLSNSLWLEKYKHWTGLLIEPDDSNFRAMKKKNRKCWIAQACLSVANYPKSTKFISHSPSHAETFRWMAKGNTHAKEHGVGSQFASYHSIEIHSVCYPLISFLSALNQTVVDFFSLDIQGGEFEVLKEFPWDEVNIRSLVVEYYSKADELIKFVKSKGYTLWSVSKEPDYFFVKTSDPVLKRVLEKYPKGLEIPYDVIV